MKTKPSILIPSVSIDFGKKAQVSTVDFIAGFLIVVTALILASNIVFTLQEKTSFSEVQDFAIAVSESLMSEGYPFDWDNDSVIKLGLLTNDSLDFAKLLELDDLSYERMKATLTFPYELYWYFQNNSGVVNITACGYGSPEVSVDALTCEPSVSAERNLVRVQRILVYNNSLLTMEVLVWDD